MRALAAAVALGVLAGCSSGAAKEEPASKVMGLAKISPKNDTTVRGVISFTQRGDRVAVAGTFFELFPGPHSIYIHAVGNCSSPNAASAGPVWNIPGNPGPRRSGDLPQLQAGTEGRADLSVTLPGLSVNTGFPNDVIGHSVVIHADVDPDPKPEYGVRTGWVACGVIRGVEAQTLRELL
jgi:Cu-Zn family superoxide dismutase